MKLAAALLGAVLLTGSGEVTPSEIDCDETVCKVSAEKMKGLYALHAQLIEQNVVLKQELVYQHLRCANGINL